MQYKEGEILKLCRDVGKPESKGFIKSGSKVKFIKLMDNPDNPDKAMVGVSYKGRTLVLREIDVQIPSWFKRKKIEWDFNKKMMKNNKELRKYHPFFPVAYYFRLHYRVKNILNDSKFMKTFALISGTILLTLVMVAIYGGLK